MEFAALRDRYCITKLTQVVVGGSTRAGSSLAGVMAASKKANVIAIHDGARPLVTPELIERVIRKAEERQAAAPVLPLKDTVKERSGDMLIKTPPRETLAAVQTPQAFRAELIRAALTEAQEQKLAITDDCSAVEAIGFRSPLWTGTRRTSKSPRRWTSSLPGKSSGGAKHELSDRTRI